MIRVGWLPTLSRPVSRRRTLPYTKRRRVKAARRPVAVNNEDMIFDQPPAELPVATLVPRDGKTQLRADLHAWFAAKWQWFKPRTIPMIVAFVGMLAVIGSANWLRNYARRAPERLVVSTPPPADSNIAVDEEPPPAPAQIVVEVGPPGATITPNIELVPTNCRFTIVEK
jgi:hypothetical protein